MSGYTSLSVFLLGAVALVLPWGYFVGPVLLLLGSVVLPIARPRLALSRAEWLIIGALVLYAVVNMLGTGWRMQPPPRLAEAGHALFAIPGLLLLLAYPPRKAAVWGGVAVGSVIAGAWASWQKFVADAVRAQGFVDKIQFGNLSLLLGVLCLAGLGWALSRHTRSGRRAWCLLLGLGALCGILGSFLSGSRGGWLSFPLMLVVLYLGYGRRLSRHWQLGLAALFVIGPMVAYAVPPLGVQERVQRVFTSYTEFVEQGDPTNSVGARLEMWRSALILIPERPLRGWGQSGYERARDGLIEKDVVHPYLGKFDHVHNDILDAWLKHGLAGPVSLLALYLAPLGLFARHLRDPDLPLRAFAVAGAVLPAAYAGFGLTQTFLAFDSGIVMYVFWLVVLWAGVRHRRESLSPDGVGGGRSVLPGNDKTNVPGSACDQG